MKNFQNKVAVITGAASGFGRAFANVAATLGMKLVLADVQQDALENTMAELQALGAHVVAIRCDVRIAQDVQALADAAMAAFGTVHLVFNNAGVACGGLIWENSQADWEWILGVNLWGVIHGIRIFTPLMLACAKNDATYEGYIVNTASMAGLLNVPNMGVYNVSKHAVVSLSETLYQDLRLVGAPIGVSVLCPYYVPTGIHRSDRNRPDELVADTEITPSQRLAQAMAEKIVSAGKISAAQVAEWTFDAIREEKFYIYSHPQLLTSVQLRLQDLVLQRNPSDPYQEVPQVREVLGAHLRGGT